MQRIVVLALGVLLALASAMPMAFGQVGQGAKASGKAAELAADWWQWALAEPDATNPLVGSYADGPQCDGRPLSDVPGKKWFLAGSWTGAVERTCIMPVGTQLFFPVGNVIYINNLPTDTEEIAREYVNRVMNAVLADPELSVVVTVDGKQIKGKRIVRTETELFTVTVPEDNLFNSPEVPAGEYDAVADGLWATLPPLSKGEHTIHVELSAPNAEYDPEHAGAEGFSQEVTYHLTVVNGKRVP
jgi:hypothetical protein